MNRLLAFVLASSLLACQPGTESNSNASVEPGPEAAPGPDAGAAAGQDAGDRLDAVLAALPDDIKARYEYRHPKETLEFFGIEPGMTVLEGLPGAGWYTRVLLPYLGEDGHVIGAAYSLEMYALFPFATDEFMARQQAWAGQFPVDAAEWAAEDGASASAFHFGAMPDSVIGTADAALLPRVLHNLARFQAEGRGNYLDVALVDVFKALKPGGVLGIVQHEARADMPDDWASGAAGYLKKQFVIDVAREAGFEFVAESPVNENPNDRPTTDDVVWRLPPTYSGTRDDPEKKAAVDAIGESNRMTLKFVKPE